MSLEGREAVDFTGSTEEEVSVVKGFVVAATEV